MPEQENKTWDTARQAADELAAERKVNNGLRQQLEEANMLSDDSEYADAVGRINELSAKQSESDAKIAGLQSDLATEKAEKERLKQDQTQAADRQAADQKAADTQAAGKAALHATLDKIGDELGRPDIRNQVLTEACDVFAKSNLAKKDAAGNYIVDDETRQLGIENQIEATFRRLARDIKKPGDEEVTGKGPKPLNADPATGGGGKQAPELPDGLSVNDTIDFMQKHKL